MSKKALIVYGGYEPHQPKECAQLFRDWLEQDGFEVRMSDALGAFADVESLKQLDLIVPHWTCGQLKPEQSQGVSAWAWPARTAGCVMRSATTVRGSS